MKNKATALQSIPAGPGARLIIDDTESSNPSSMSQTDVQACLDAQLIEYVGRMPDNSAIVYRLTHNGRVLLGELHRKKND